MSRPWPFSSRDCSPCSGRICAGWPLFSAWPQSSIRQHGFSLPSLRLPRLSAARASCAIPWPGAPRLAADRRLVAGRLALRFAWLDVLDQRRRRQRPVRIGRSWTESWGAVSAGGLKAVVKGGMVVGFTVAAVASLCASLRSKQPTRAYAMAIPAGCLFYFIFLTRPEIWAAVCFQELVLPLAWNMAEKPFRRSALRLAASVVVLLVLLTSQFALRAVRRAFQHVPPSDRGAIEVSCAGHPQPPAVLCGGNCRPEPGPCEKMRQAENMCGVRKASWVLQTCRACPRHCEEFAASRDSFA